MHASSAKMKATDYGVVEFHNKRFEFAMYLDYTTHSFIAVSWLHLTFGVFFFARIGVLVLTLKNIQINAFKFNLRSVHNKLSYLFFFLKDHNKLSYCICGILF